MAIYAVWNNKGGVGKSYLTFQLASEYARQNPTKKVWWLTCAHKRTRPLCYLVE